MTFQRVSGGMRNIGACVVMVGLLAGCAETGTQSQRQAAACGGLGSGNKQDIGTALGGVGAGLAVGLLTHNWVAGLGGAAVGGLVGNRIGAALDADDCRALVAQSARALREAEDGSAVDWASAKTGTRASIVPSNTRTVSRPITISLESDVTPTPGLEAIGANYLVRRTASIHLAADTTAPLAAESPLRAGSYVRVVGRVPDAPWLLVAQQGSAVGYVAQSSLVSTRLAQAHPLRHRQVHTTEGVTTAPAETGDVQTARNDVQAPTAAAAATPYDLDANAPIRPMDLDAPAPGAPVSAKPGAPLTTETVTASVQCRDLATTMTLKGQSQTSTATACRSPDGAWELDDSQAKQS